MEKEKMTAKETMSALKEMLEFETEEQVVEHLKQLADRVVSKEVPFSDWDSTEDTGYLEELQEKEDDQS